MQGNSGTLDSLPEYGTLDSLPEYGNLESVRATLQQASMRGSKSSPSRNGLAPGHYVYTTTTLDSLTESTYSQGGQSQWNARGFVQTPSHQVFPSTTLDSLPESSEQYSTIMPEQLSKLCESLQQGQWQHTAPSSMGSLPECSLDDQKVPQQAMPRQFRAQWHGPSCACASCLQTKSKEAALQALFDGNSGQDMSRQLSGGQEMARQFSGGQPSAQVPMDRNASQAIHGQAMLPLTQVPPADNFAQSMMPVCYQQPVYQAGAPMPVNGYQQPMVMVMPMVAMQSVDALDEVYSD